MRALRPIVGYIALVFVGGALLAYPFYSLLDLCWSEAPPFHKVVHRTLKLLALVGLWPLLHWLGLSSRSQWGYGASLGAFAKDLSLGLLLGIGSLGLLVVFLVLLDVRVLTYLPEMPPLVFLVIFGKAVAVGLVIGLVEETWFRGALFGAIAWGNHPLWAVWVTAILFGLVHFVRADPAIVPLAPTWTDGFAVIASSFYLFAGGTFVDSLLALVAAGFLLGLIRLNRGHIACCVGVHAGWVAVIKTTNKVSELNIDSPLASLVGNYDGVMGYLAFLVLSVYSLGYYVLAGRWKT